MVTPDPVATGIHADPVAAGGTAGTTGDGCGDECGDGCLTGSRGQVGDPLLYCGLRYTTHVIVYGGVLCIPGCKCGAGIC